ncbi:hypothetical protein HYY71_00680 [Candidatus Woesearchaeota archaeon]|nr:hypothetical protein [Candidatus Woesearchaeota archaeon]
MRIYTFLAFLALCLILVAPNSLARDVEITEIRVGVEYNKPYVYQLPYTSLMDKDKIDTFVTSSNESQRINADVFPGSNITFSIFVDNSIAANGPEIRNAFATITIEEIDDGTDLFAESGEFDLERGEQERVDMKFELPLAVAERLYDVTIEVEGEDLNHTRYSDIVSLKLDVRKQLNDIRIASVELSPQEISCDRKTRLTARIMNLGSRDENEAALEFRNSALGVKSVTQDIFLKNFFEVAENATSYTKTLDIELPSFFKSGKYPILVNLYWKNFILFDQKTVDLIVKDCSSAERVKESGQEKMQENKTQAGAVQQEDKTKSSPEEEIQEEATSTKESSFLDSQSLFLMFAGYVLVMFALIALIVFAYFKIYK